MPMFDEDYIVERDAIDRIKQTLPQYEELHAAQMDDMTRLRLVQQLQRDIKLLEGQEKLAASQRFIQAQRDAGAPGYV